MHFPRLRLLWCPSPYTTAELFDDLKVCSLMPVSCRILWLMYSNLTNWVMMSLAAFWCFWVLHRCNGEGHLSLYLFITYVIRHKIQFLSVLIRHCPWPSFFAISSSVVLIYLPSHVTISISPLIQLEDPEKCCKLRSEYSRIRCFAAFQGKICIFQHYKFIPPFHVLTS